VQTHLRQLVRARELAVKHRTADQQELLATTDKDIRAHLRGCIRFLEKRIAQLEALIARTVADNPDTRRLAEALETIQGVGSLTAAVIVALVPELGTLGRRRAASLCGCAPHPADSGTHTGRRRTGAGREGVRKVLYMPALSAAFHNPHLKPFYQRLRIGRHKPGHIPLVAVMRKLFVHMDAIAAQVLKQAAGQDGPLPECAPDNNMSSETP
jgi:transposase